VLNGREQMLQTLQQEFGTCAIMDVDGLHLVHQQRALGVDEQMTLSALGLLAAIVPARSAYLSGFDRLAVDDCRCRRRRPADCAAIALAQDLSHVLPGAVLAPLGIVVEDSRSAWILVRQLPPFGAGAQQLKTYRRCAATDRSAAARPDGCAGQGAHAALTPHH
jgi:hypothetical protein